MAATFAPAVTEPSRFVWLHHILFAGGLAVAVGALAAFSLLSQQGISPAPTRAAAPAVPQPMAGQAVQAVLYIVSSPEMADRLESGEQHAWQMRQQQGMSDWQYRYYILVAGPESEPLDLKLASLALPSRAEGAGSVVFQVVDLRAK